jgi:cell division septum initiation protein DivIVA
MPLTLVEVCEKLKRVDEVSLMEMLDIHSDDLVLRFIDIVEDRYEQLAEELDDTGQ